jgi:hypothetical protein
MRGRLRKKSLCGLHYQINIRFVFHLDLKYLLFEFKAQSPRQWRVVENFSYNPEARSLPSPKFQKLEVYSFHIRVSHFPFLFIC